MKRFSPPGAIRPPAWFLAVIAVSLAIRLYLVFDTDGTYDVGIWQMHAESISRIGLIPYYHAALGSGTQFNHPPLAGLLIRLLHDACLRTGVPFKAGLRLPFALLDFVAAYLLLTILADRPRKYLLVAGYLLAPVTFLLSAYHGNTDSLVGLCALLSVYYFTKEKYWLSGAILGLGASVKWAICIIAPVLFFSAPGRRERAKLMISSLAAVLMGYGYFLLRDPRIIVDSVFRYGGQMIQTTAGTPIWGNRIFYLDLMHRYLRLFHTPSQDQFLAALRFCLAFNQLFLAVLVVSYAWLKRAERSVPGPYRTAAVLFCLLYGVSNYFSFQYFAWSLPFLLFLDTPLAVSIFAAISGYLYLLYALDCGSFLLSGPWDFAGHPQLTLPVQLFRDLSILLFMACAVYFPVNALLDLCRADRHPAACDGRKTTAT